MNQPGAPSPRALKLFVSYAHEDDALRIELAKHLSQLRREGLIEDWHDRLISGGREWANEIDDNLEAADIVLLLVSASFLASDYCYDKEMARALQRHEASQARVIPIILKSCDWQTAPFGKLQAFPKGGRPICKWEPMDDGYLDVVQGLRRAISKIQATANAEMPPAALALASSSPRNRKAWLLWMLGIAFLAAGFGAYWWLKGNPRNPTTSREALQEEQSEQIRSIGQGVTTELDPLSAKPRADPGSVRREAVDPMPANKYSTLYVLAVGVSVYQDGDLSQVLPFAAKDAAAVKAHFEQYGAKLYRAVNARGLQDEQATRANIEKELREFATRIGPRDVFVLYLAGWDATFELSYHFIPYDAVYINGEVFRRKSLDQDTLRTLLAGIDTKKALVLLDTCNLGAFGEQREQFVKDKKAIDQFSEVTRRAIIAAAADRKMASTGEGDHGVFTFALLEGLRGAADDDKNGTIEVRELAEYIERNVPKITKRKWNKEQFPFHHVHNATFSVLAKP